MARIALISDISPVPLTAGSMVLYRHFARMRQHELLVVSGTIPEPDPVDRHWAVLRLPRRHRRLMRPISRPLFEEIRAVEIAHELRDTLNAFRPQIILSVWTAEYLLAAARLAKEYHVPLVLICHDDFESMLPAQPHVRWWARRRLGDVYRSASARLCVSDSMRETFEGRYRAPARVMYPIPEAVVVRDGPSDDLPSDGKPLKVGTFGNIGGDISRVLLSVADALAGVGGTLHFASTVTGPIRQRLSAHPSVVDCGTFTSPAALQAHFQHAVDAMLVPQSFRSVDSATVALQFPSKLTDCAQLNMPLLVVAPHYASAARWAAEHPSASLLCTDLQPDTLASTLEKLRQPGRLSALAAGVAEVAKRTFDPETIHGVLENALEQAVANPPFA